MSFSRLTYIRRLSRYCFQQQGPKICCQRVITRDIIRRTLASRSLDSINLSALRQSSNTSNINKDGRRHYSVNFEDLEISTQQFNKELKRGDDLYIIDVRDPDEVEAAGKIPNSKLIPMGELESALNMSEDRFNTKFGFDKPPEDGDDVIFYCHAGMRSLRATMFARSLGYNMSKSLSGGYMAWLNDKES